MAKFLKTVKWERARSVLSASMAAAPISGVYVMGRVISTAELPIAVEWVYVGRSINLRQRLGQHQPLAENHIALREWVVANWHEVEVWFTSTTPEEARWLEIELIRELRPRFNRVQYITERKVQKGEDHHEFANIAGRRLGKQGVGAGGKE